MPFLQVYIVKLSLSLSLVYMFYRLVLQRLTFYNWNRFYLFGYTVLSFLIPFINITPVLEKNEMLNNRVVSFIPSVDGFANHHPSALATDVQQPVSWPVWNVLSVCMLAGMFILFLRMLIQFLSIRKMIARSELISDAGVKFYHVNKKITPFSFGNSIFINRKLHHEDELTDIVKHEFIHVRQKHTVDIVWAEMLCILNWYNPVVWLIRKAIRQNLEFIADNKVLQSGIDRKQYQYLLLKVTGNNHFSIASQFNFSSLKNRIAMMNKMKSARMHLIKFLFVLPLIAVLLVAFRNKDELRHNKGSGQSAAMTTRNANALIIDTALPQDNYIIEVIVHKNKANTVVLIKDKKTKKELKRMSLQEWDKNKTYYESIYGRVDGIVEDENHPLLITTDDAGDVYKLKKDTSDVIVSQYIKITDDNKASVTLDGGQTEIYDLNIAGDRMQFEKKYGRIIPRGAAAAGYSGTTISSHVERSSAVEPVESSTAINDATMAVTNPSVGSATVAGTSSVSTTVGPIKEVATAENIVVVFKKGMHEADVKKLVSDLKDRGYDFNLTKTEYKNGELVLIKGRISKGNHKQYFTASDFSRLIITDSPDKNDDEHFNFLVEQGRLSVNNTPEWQ